MTGSNSDRRKRALLAVAATTAIAAVVVAWNVRVGDATDSFGPGRDAVSANPEPSPQTPGAATRRSHRTSDSRPAVRQSRTPLPPPGSPLAQIYDKLKRRADAGDAAATTRLFHDVHRCNVVQQERHELAEVMPHFAAANEKAGNASYGIVRDSRVDVKLVSAGIDFVQANSVLCDGVTVEQLESITPLTLQMAQLGDLNALNCYVGTDFEGMQGLLDHPEWIEQYRAQVPGLVESALQRGDWVTVDLLHHAYSGAFNTSARGQLFGVDPAMDYRVLRLEQLGATGAFADKLAPMVAGAAKALLPTQVADAEAWANDYYSRYFNSASNEVSNDANICDITDD